MDIEEYKRKMANCDDPSEAIKVMSEYRGKIKETEKRDAVARYNEYSKDADYFNKLFKKYLTKETLKVMDEAIPIILGVLPSDWFKLRAKFNYGHQIFEVIDSDRYGSLNVINGDKRKGLWRVSTKEFFKWADAKGLLKAKGIIEALKSAKGSEVVHSKPQRAKKYSKDREVLLSAVVAVLANYPEDCRQKSGNVSASKIASIVEQKSPIWWPDGEIPFSIETMARHIREAINTLK